MLKVNSREVNPGDTFLALPGIETDGHDYIEEAIDKGAACIIADHGEYDVKTIITSDTRTYLSNYLKELYFEKIEKIKIIAIVGTYGKTITGDIICKLLNNLSSKTAYIGTNGFYLNGKITKLKSTTPDIYDIYELINKAIDENCDNIIIEVSSRAIKQRHLEGLRFDIAIYTNLITDGLDKKQIEDYLNSKIEIFKMVKKDGHVIINKKDKYYKYFVLPQNHNIFYGTSDSDYKVSDINLTYDMTYFNINENPIELPILGSFNIYNYLPAYIISTILHFSNEAIFDVSKEIKPTDGRYQNIKYKDSLIIIDYAYEIKTIENVINYTKEYNKGRIITLIGCGGERRINQRPTIGKIVTEITDYVIFTTDNPRYEEPENIINDIIKEVNKNNYEIIVNRKEAIKKGIEILKENDILLILGKGHEDTQIIGSDRFPFKDYNEVIKNIK